MMKKGFTLLEILLVIAAIGILAAIVIVAINPNRQLAQARDAERSSEINTLYKALNQYLIDNGEYPSEVAGIAGGTYGEVCAEGVSLTDCQNAGLIYLGDLVPDYIAGIPSDPQTSGNSAGYHIHVSPASASAIAVLETDSEQDDVVSVGTVSEGVDVVSAGLLQYYDFEDGFDDQSSSGLDFTSVGSPTLVESGDDLAYFSNQNALSLDGSSYLDSGVSSMNNLTEFSVSVWFRGTEENVSGIRDLVGQNDLVEISFWSPNTLGLWHSATSAQTNVNADFYNGDWYHFVVTYDNGNVEVFLNGQSEASSSNTPNPANYTSSYDFRIGDGVSSPSGRTFTGEIDEVRVYDRVLTSEEIGILYAN